MMIYDTKCTIYKVQYLYIIYMHYIYMCIYVYIYISYIACIYIYTYDIHILRTTKRAPRVPQHSSSFCRVGRALAVRHLYHLALLGRQLEPKTIEY